MRRTTFGSRTRQSGSAPVDAKSYLRVKTAAAFADCSTQTIRRWIESGELPAHRPTPGLLLIKKADLDAFLSST